MLNFRHLEALNPAGHPVKVTIASGPVIIENGKVLLDKHGEDNFWKFPGGSLAENISMSENARQEVLAELGIKVKIEGKPFILVFHTEKERKLEYFVLIHYLAKRLSPEVKPGNYVREWAWHNLDDLPQDIAPNIKPVIQHFT